MGLLTGQPVLCRNSSKDGIKIMRVGQIVIEKRTGKRARITAVNKDWQIEIAYIDEEGKDLHPNAIAWLHPSLVRLETSE